MRVIRRSKAVWIYTRDSGNVRTADASSNANFCRARPMIVRSSELNSTGYARTHKLDSLIETSTALVLLVSFLGSSVKDFRHANDTDIQLGVSYSSGYQDRKDAQSPAASVEGICVVSAVRVPALLFRAERHREWRA